MSRPPTPLIVGGYAIASGVALITLWLVDRRHK